MHASCACRNPREYFAIFDAAMCVEPDGSRARFELVSCKCVDTYVRVKHNQNQARMWRNGNCDMSASIQLHLIQLHSHIIFSGNVNGQGADAVAQALP